MTIKEFTERTGFHPTHEHYQAIEGFYMRSDDNKDTFCEAYKNNVDGIAEKIAQTVDNKLKYERNSHHEYVNELKDRIARQTGVINDLQTQLDAELEWMPYKGAGTQMSQADYKRLEETLLTEPMTDEEAANFIAEELGFNASRVKIIHTVETFEVNKHHYIRVLETYDREPLYVATDWNYIRFDVYSMAYEYINGRLVLYCR